jgi:hypothetical protein
MRRVSIFDTEGSRPLAFWTNLTNFVQVLSLSAHSKALLQEILTKVDSSDPHLDTVYQLEYNDLC